MAWTLIEHANADALADACGEALMEVAMAALAQRGEAAFAIAGGRTPLPSLSVWSERMALDARTRITLTDERWVPAAHPDSNLARLQACFATGRGPRWLPLVPANAGHTPDLAQARDAMADCPGDWDLVLLGMGEDGHFASLFPNDPQLPAWLDPSAKDDVVIARPVPLPPDAPHARITQTLARLLRSRRRLLLVTGGNKREVLRQASQSSAPLPWPVSALLHAPGAPVEIHWSP